MTDLYQHNYADRMTPMITLSLKTGMRRGELFDLRWDDIDFTNRILTIPGVIAKSSKTRHIPLSPIAFETITNWKAQAPIPTGRVFPSDDGNRLDNVKNSWKSILEAAAIESFRWHDMRHDFASKLVMKGVPLNTVRELCGHADLNTTLRYAHLAPDHKADAIAFIS
jgi:integrase